MTSYPLSCGEDEGRGGNKLVTTANPSDNRAIYSVTVKFEPVMNVFGKRVHGCTASHAEWLNSPSASL